MVESGFAMGERPAHHVYKQSAGLSGKRCDGELECSYEYLDEYFKEYLHGEQQREAHGARWRMVERGGVGTKLQERLGVRCIRQRGNGNAYALESDHLH